MDHTLALIMKSQQGDKEARDTVFKENAGLVYSMAKRFAGRSVEMEDIVQIGSIGLLKAIDRFDISYDDFKEAGIYPQVSRSKSITLEAAVTGEVTYARKVK